MWKSYRPPASTSVKTVAKSKYIKCHNVLFPPFITAHIRMIKIWICILILCDTQTHKWQMCTLTDIIQKIKQFHYFDLLFLQFVVDNQYFVVNNIKTNHATVSWLAGTLSTICYLSISSTYDHFIHICTICFNFVFHIIFRWLIYLYINDKTNQEIPCLIHRCL